jgi:hypothetical protein
MASEADMSFFLKLLASLHPHQESPAKTVENLRAEDGFVRVEKIGSRGFLRIY